MDLFKRNRSLSADYIAAPVELSAEARVIELDELIALARRKGDMETADALLDDRNVIRPPRVATVPVIPGRTP